MERQESGRSKFVDCTGTRYGQGATRFEVEGRDGTSNSSRPCGRPLELPSRSEAHPSSPRDPFFLQYSLASVAVELA